MPERSDLELLEDWAAASRALKERKLVRTAGQAPTGEYAELLLERHLGARRPAGPDRGVDLERTDDQGQVIRTQVKARRKAGGRRDPSHVDLTAFSAKRRKARDRFDELAIVVFEEDFSIDRAWLVSRAAIERGLGRPTRSGKIRIRFAELEAASHDPDVQRCELLAAQ